MSATWPFTHAQLTAGLRRYFADSTLTITAVSERPVERPAALGAHATPMRGLRIEYGSHGETLTLDCLLKEPRGLGRTGMAGLGLREVGVYRSLSPQLPMQTPALIAADASGGWLVLEAVTADVAWEAWTADDYQRAIRALVMLHERFWNLAEDLAVYPWLARPLTSDFEILVMSAVGAMEKMMVDNHHQLITSSVEVLTSLGQMLTQVETMVAVLRATPPTLLHGDYQPVNIALQEEDELVVFGWHSASVGPGVLDLVGFINAARWARADLPVTAEALLALYRAEIAARVGADWSDEAWAELLDHATMWRFVQELLGWAAQASPEEFTAHEARFREIWLEPVLAAVRRRLRPALYL